VIGKFYDLNLKVGKQTLANRIAAINYLKNLKNEEGEIRYPQFHDPENIAHIKVLIRGKAQNMRNKAIKSLRSKQRIKR
jgi:hypothetical protein